MSKDFGSQITKVRASLQNFEVFCVAYIDPPIPTVGQGFDTKNLRCDGTTTHPDFWASSSLEKVKLGRFNNNGARLVSSKWDPRGGVSVLLAIRFESMFSFHRANFYSKISGICSVCEWDPKTVGDSELCRNYLSNYIDLLDGSGCNMAARLFIPGFSEYNKEIAKHMHYTFGRSCQSLYWTVPLVESLYPEFKKGNLVRQNSFLNKYWTFLKKRFPSKGGPYIWITS